MPLAAELERIATARGFSGFGISGADAFGDTRIDLEAAVADGRSAGLGFTFGDPARSTDVKRSFQWARTLITAAHPYLPDGGHPGPSAPGTGRVARFATEDHYTPLRAGLEEMAETLRSAGHQAVVLCDDNGLVDRAAAVRSGVGWWGKSSMVLMPGTGPWSLLGSVVTDVDLEPTAAMKRDCGTCVDCIAACPTGAIVAPGVLDARRCLAAIAQSKRDIPNEFRQVMADRVYGCDDCLTSCPPGQRLAEAASQRRGRVDLVDMVRMADRPLRRRWAHFFVPRNEARYLKRNVIVALGNEGDVRHVALLAGLLGHPDRVLRVHAAWALGAIGDLRAQRCLMAARRYEEDPSVLTEIDTALGTLS